MPKMLSIMVLETSCQWKISPNSLLMGRRKIMETGLMRTMKIMRKKRGIIMEGSLRIRLGIRLPEMRLLSNRWKAVQVLNLLNITIQRNLGLPSLEPMPTLGLKAKRCSWMKNSSKAKPIRTHCNTRTTTKCKDQNKSNHKRTPIRYHY